MAGIEIHSIASHPEWIEPVATWWHRQWGSEMGYSPEGAREAINQLTLPGSGEAALIALADGKPAGSAFLVRSDLESHPHLTPWLAGLFVLPEFRKIGVGRSLVAAIVTEAAALGHDTIYLYTSIGQFYLRQGWTRRETLTLHGVEHEIMTCPTNFRSRQ